MLLSDIANLISVRNFLANSIENMQIRIAKEDMRSVQAKVAEMDKKIISETLKLDLNYVVPPAPTKVFERSSTEDTEVVLKRAFSREKKKDEPKKEEE